MGLIRTGLLVACVALPSILSAQIRPDQPLRHFLIPMFNEENGFLSWELRGLEGIYKSPRESIIIGLDLTIFSGDEHVRVENRIRSPRARIHLEEGRAEGDSSLFVTGPNFSLTGEDWTWDGTHRAISVRRSARVTFDEAIDILR
ncbi:MAG: hypothetical protein JJT96_00860 [Opitutales bacterium]|nr:hypothetical protein [Opitutales bacterium]